jgi:hypothetical protein
LLALAGDMGDHGLVVCLLRNTGFWQRFGKDSVSGLAAKEFALLG